MWPKIWSSKYLPWLALFLAVGIRLYGSTTTAQPYDMGTYNAWGNHLLSVGARHFFDNIWSDYLPLPILSFGIPAYLSQVFHWDFSFIFKLFHSAIEVILILLLPNLPLLPKLLLLLSPALIGDTSFWGQVDSIPSLLALLSLSLLLNKPNTKYKILSAKYFSAALFGLAVAYKPILILVAPVLWIVAIQKKYFWQFPLFSAATFFATGIPTGGWSFLPHLYSRIMDQAGTYPFMTINAWNLWSLVPNLAWIPDSGSVLGISARALGLTLFTLFTLIIFNHWRKLKFAPQFAPRLAATILILFYAFTTRMHERHLLFGLPFLTLAVPAQSFLWLPLFLLTCTFSLNLYSAFYWVNHAQVWPLPLWVTSLSSWAIVLTAISLAFIWDWQKSLSSLFSLLKSNKLLVGILLIASLLRLTNLSHPRAYIFDEVYHAFTAKEYLHNRIEAWEWWTTPPEGVAYEWTHPPVAKYGMVLGMLLFGEDEFGYRVGSAALGIISILGIYMFTLAVFQQKKLALLASLLASLEGLHISQSRIAMNDIYMLCFFVWSLYAAVKSRWKWSAVLYGLALGCKWSALYGIVPLTFIYLHSNNPLSWNLKSSIRHLVFAIRMLLVTLAVYVLTFTPFILAGHTWDQWWELRRQMWYYHTHLVATHGYQSTPLQWVVSARPVWYWVDYAGSLVSNIYAQGNPVLLWLGLIAAIMLLPRILRFPYTISYLLYSIFTLPWVFSPRIMFFYHYLPSATFLCVILAAWLFELPYKYRVLCLILISSSLILIAPLLYGLPTPEVYRNTIFGLFPSWK